MTSTAATRSDRPVDTAAVEAVRRRCRHGHRGFYYACAFLPPAKRDGAFALRSFVELVEQAILDCGDNDAPAPPSTVGISCCGTSGLDQRLALVRQRIEQLYADDPIELPRPEFRTVEQQVLAAAHEAIRRFEVPRSCWSDLIDGCATEARTRRFATRASVERFMRQRAGAIGRALVGVSGATHSDAGSRAELLAMAVRWTGIIASVSLDWQRGRLYLPLEEMARCGYSERQLSDGVVNERFRDLIGAQVEQARRWFREGAELIPWLADDGSRVTAATLAVSAAGRLRAIEQAGYDVLRSSPGLPWAHHARALPAAWRLSRRRVGEPMPNVF